MKEIVFTINQLSKITGKINIKISKFAKEHGIDPTPGVKDGQNVKFYPFRLLKLLCPDDWKRRLEGLGVELGEWPTCLLCGQQRAPDTMTYDRDLFTGKLVGACKTCPAQEPAKFDDFPNGDSVWKLSRAKCDVCGKIKFPIHFADLREDCVICLRCKESRMKSGSPFYKGSR